MNKVVITSKTRMSRGYCVGGYDISNKKFVRLLTNKGYNQGYDTQFEIGELWRLNYNQREKVTPPHVEDVLVTKSLYIRTINDFSEFLQKRVTVHDGDINELFDNKLGFTAKGGPFISSDLGIPENSVGFWLTPNELTLINSDDGKARYKVEGTNYEIPYVGIVPRVQSIPANTLVRVSLARWWSPKPGEFEDRCYMQLSGWYENAN